MWEAVRQHKDARSRTQSWATAVIEDIYAEIETREKRAETTIPPLSGSSIPDVIYNHFHQKFGSKMADEYLGSFRNTLLHFKVQFGSFLSLWEGHVLYFL